MFYIAYAGGEWVYPILEHFDDGQRVIFIIVCAVLMVILYFSGEACNSMVWGNVSKDYKSGEGMQFKTQEAKRNRPATNKRKYY